MVTVSDVMDSVARDCSTEPPSAWITATDTEYLELKDYLRRVVTDILDRVDLPSPIGAEYDLTGDGTETYNLPSKFHRLHRDTAAVFETTSQRRPVIPVANDGDWRHLKEIGSTGAERYFRLRGQPGAYTIDIYALPSTSITFQISYNSTNWLETAGGTGAGEWSNNDDVLRLPRDIIEIGVTMRWRRRRGLAYMDLVSEYESRIARLANDSRPRRHITFGRRARRSSPFDVPVPDFIPSS